MGTEKVRELNTPRLRLRGWRATDLEPIAAISADPRVGEWLGGVIHAEETGSRLRAYAPLLALTEMRELPLPPPGQ